MNQTGLRRLKEPEMRIRTALGFSIFMYLVALAEWYPTDLLCHDIAVFIAYACVRGHKAGPERHNVPRETKDYRALMGNGLAYLMLAAWPAICVVLFTRLSVERALLWSIFGAYMFLPPVTQFDLPLVPAMTKHSIPSVAALVIIVAVVGLRPSFIPKHRTTSILVLGMLSGSILTVLANSDPITFGVVTLPGLRLIDTLSVLAEMLILLIPFFLARVYLSTDKGLRELVIAFALAGVIYSVPTLIEVAVGPNLNIWIYGFFQHSIESLLRDGRFRPYVFTQHALWIALFFVMAIAASAALLRQADRQNRAKFAFAIGYLVVVLFLCQSLASQAYTVLLLPLILLATAKWQIRVALCLAVVGVLYPVIRNLGLVPIEWGLAQIEDFNPERAQSLGYRFLNEALLLDRAAERPWFGWGGWARNHIHVPETGDLLTTVDGRWIFIFGTFGWFGYVSQMGLVAWPLILVAWYRKKHPNLQLSPFIPPLCLMLGFNMLDMLLNDTMVPMTLLMIGAILGYAERLAAEPSEKPRLFGKGPVIGRHKKGTKRTVL